MAEDEFPEADQLDGAPHPRMTERLFGHGSAEDEVLRAFNDNRLPQAWLLSGPRGVGKATLAWRIARFLLSQPAPGQGAGLFGDPEEPTTLDVPFDSAVAHRIAALSEPNLLLLRRGWDVEKKRLRTQITVDEVRRLNEFFGLSSVDGGRRVVIVDSADEMNASAANALLKVLEEPPANALLLLISHQPARLLPTIRSRCRSLRLEPVDNEALMAALGQAGFDPEEPELLMMLSGGSIGEAIRVLGQDGLKLYQRVIDLVQTCPRLDRSAALSLAEFASARGSEQRLDMVFRLIDVVLVQLARTALGFQSETGLDLSRLAPHGASANDWAELQQSLSARISHGRGVNIDPQALMMDAFLSINATASRHV